MPQQIYRQLVKRNNKLNECEEMRGNAGNDTETKKSEEQSN